MSLESIKKLICHAREHHYAIGYFESWDLPSLQGVIDAAEKTSSPMIIGFNGDFLSHPDRLCIERLTWYAQLGLAAANSASVPCGFIFNECPEDTWVRQAVDAGFNLVMPADPDASDEDYQQRVSQIVVYAHEHHVAVEAEIGQLPCHVSDAMKAKGRLTSPQEAARFVRETNVDLLAVSVGNVHITTHGSQDLDLHHLQQLHQHVGVPLVLHGGSGISEESLVKAIGLGVVKVNYGTYLKQRYLETLRQKLTPAIDNPHALLGMGGQEDILVACRQAVCDAVLERIALLGCCQMANQYTTQEHSVQGRQPSLGPDFSKGRL